MRTDANKALFSLSTSRCEAIGKKRCLWISFGIAALLIIPAVIVPTTIVLTRKKNISTTTVFIETSTTTTTTAITTATMTTTTTTTAPFERCAGNYSVVVPYSRHSRYNYMISDDMNGDNRPDIVLSDISMRVVKILFNNANDTFSGVSYQFSNQFQSIGLTTADINNDKKVDMMVLSDRSPEILLYLNAGDGAFTGKSVPFHRTHSVLITTAELDNDDKSDVIVLNEGSENISILFNTSDNEFTKQLNHYMQCRVFALTTANINNDSNIDIIGTCPDDSKIIIHFNTGNGRDYTHKDIVVGYKSFLVVAADINKDNDVDLITLNVEDDTIRINFNNGGLFYASDYLNTDSYPVSLAAGDINGDTEIDIVVAYMYSHNIGIFFHIGSGPYPVFLEQKTYSVGISVFSLAVRDVNTDNRFDIIVAHNQSIGILFIDCDR